MITLRYIKKWRAFQVVDKQGKSAHFWEDNIAEAYNYAKFLQSQSNDELYVTSSAVHRYNMHVLILHRQKEGSNA